MSHLLENWEGIQKSGLIFLNVERFVNRNEDWRSKTKTVQWETVSVQSSEWIAIRIQHRSDKRSKYQKWWRLVHNINMSEGKYGMEERSRIQNLNDEQSWLIRKRFERISIGFHSNGTRCQRRPNWGKTDCKTDYIHIHRYTYNISFTPMKFDTNIMRNHIQKPIDWAFKNSMMIKMDLFSNDKNILLHIFYFVRNINQGLICFTLLCFWHFSTLISTFSFSHFYRSRCDFSSVSTTFPLWVNFNPWQYLIVQMSFVHFTRRPMT